MRYLRHEANRTISYRFGEKVVTLRCVSVAMGTWVVNKGQAMDELDLWDEVRNGQGHGVGENYGRGYVSGGQPGATNVPTNRGSQ